MAKENKNSKRTTDRSLYKQSVKSVAESILVGALTMLMLSVLSVGILLSVMIIM